MTPLESIHAAARESREREEKATPGPWILANDAQGPCMLMHPTRPGVAVASLTNTFIPSNGFVEIGSPGAPERTANANVIVAARTELGEWRDLALRACSALDQIRQGDPYVQGLRPELYGHAMALAGDELAKLAAVAEKLRRGRG